MDVISTSASASKQIKQMLSVILAAVFVGITAVGGIVYFYGIHRTYKVSQLLLHPEWIGRIAPEGHSTKRFSVANADEGVLLISSDPHSGMMRTQILTSSEYRRFYETIAYEKSLRIPSDRLHQSFSRGPTSRLILKVKKTLELNQGPFIAQEIQIAPFDGIFRIDISSSMSGLEYAYFQSSKIDEVVRNISSRGL
jgi:hypothetical protein